MENTLNLTLFGKRRQTKDGKNFMSYLTKLTKKNGEEVTASVKFRDGVTPPSELPANIVVNKVDASLSPRKYDDAETGETHIGYTLWIGAYTDGEPYVDHSLDEF